MKKILFSLMAVVLCLGLMGGAFAYFSDVETSEDNTFSAGTIDLLGPFVFEVEGYHNLENLKPCETGFLFLLINNAGTNEMDIWKHLYNVECYENEVIEPELEWYLANGISPEVGKNDIDTVMLYSVYVRVYDEQPYTGGPDPVDTRDIIDPLVGQIVTVSQVECKWVYLGVLQPGQWMMVVQDYHLFDTVENWAQSDNMTFDIDFLAQQTTGDAPPPDPELEGYGKP